MLTAEGPVSYTEGGVLSTLSEAQRKAPERIGEYRIVRQLGAGGFGAVYEGLHDGLGRRAAIKVLHAELSSNSEMAVRFVNEARAANIIRHSGIVDVSDIGQLPSGAVYIIMEFLEGTTLRAHLKEEGGRLPLLPTLRLGQQIAAALAAAHSKGVVHRDLKPDNVMLLSDPLVAGGLRTKLVDFGIAKLAEEHSVPEQKKTRTGMLMGTPAYMSPEQCRGAGLVEAKSDVYSLGIILYQMLVGRRPFESDGEGEILGMHLFAEPKPLLEIDATLDRETTELVHRMLRKDPKDRPSMTEVAEALLRRMQTLGESSSPNVSAGGRATLTPTPTIHRAAATRRGLPSFLIGGGVLLVAGAVVCFIAFGSHSHSPPAPTSASAPISAPPATLAGPAPSSAPVSAPPIAAPPPVGADRGIAAAPPDDAKPKGGRHRRGSDERAGGRVGKGELPPELPPTAAQAPASTQTTTATPSSPPVPAAAPAGPDPQVKATVDAAKVDYAFGRYAQAMSLARGARNDRIAGRILGAAACRVGDLTQAGEAYQGAAAAERSYIEAECQKAGVKLVNGRFVSAAPVSP